MSKRGWGCVLVLALLGCVMIAIGAAAAPQKTVDDYSALFKLIPDASISEYLRPPTAEEIGKMGPLWPTVPPEKNAIYYLVKANKELTERCEKLPEPPGSLSTEYSFDGDAAGFIHYINENASVLATIKEAMGQRALQFPWTISKLAPFAGIPLPAGLADCRNLARFLSDAGFAAELEGKPEAAAEMYMQCMQMGKRLREDPIVLGNLVGIACQAIGATPLESLIENGSLDEATLKRIIEFAREMETTPKTLPVLMAREIELMRVMRAMSPEVARQLVPDNDEFAAYMAKTYSLPIPELLKSVENATKEVKEKYPSLAQEAVGYFVLPKKWAASDVAMRVEQVRAAIALYGKKHGAPPESLEKLVPEFLPEVPADPFDGKPLRYLSSRRHWKLWSVGFDLKDDGGEASIVAEKGYVGPDFVYVDEMRSNVERRRSRGAIKSQPVPAEKPLEPAPAGK